MKRLLAMGTMLALAACGARGDLEPPQGQALPPAPYGATATPTPPDLLEPPVQTRPARSDDFVESADKRRSDKFDLPPPN
jgi:predicted small lipoprotein YifL